MKKGKVGKENKRIIFVSNNSNMARNFQGLEKFWQKLQRLQNLCLKV